MRGCGVGAGAVPGAGADEAHPRGRAGARGGGGAVPAGAAAARAGVPGAHGGAAPPQVPPLHHADRAAARLTRTRTLLFILSLLSQNQTFC